MRQQGFSLIELLMGLMIIGIVLQLISPAYAALTESNHREAAAQSLISAIRAARSEAVTRNQTVVVHAIDDDWSQGWRIIVDISGKGHEDTHNPLLVEQRSDARVPIAGNGQVVTFVRFSGLGEPLMPNHAFQAGTLYLCAAREPVSHLQVVLARSGRVRLDNQKVEQALCSEEKRLKAKNARAALLASRR